MRPSLFPGRFGKVCVSSASQGTPLERRPYSPEGHPRSVFPWLPVVRPDGSVYALTEEGGDKILGLTLENSPK